MYSTMVLRVEMSFRADVGTLIQVSKFLSVDLGLTVRSAVDVINYFWIECTNISEPEKKNIKSSCERSRSCAKYQ